MLENGLRTTHKKPGKHRKSSQYGEIIKRIKRNKTAMIGLYIFILFVLLAVLAPAICPYNYDEMDLGNAYALPSRQHLFGTDNLGRDIFSRIIYGARYSLGLGVCAQIFGIVIGVFLGCIAGYFGEKADMLIMRMCDIFQSIPALLLAIVISATLGGGFLNSVIALGVSSIPMGVRLIRAQFLSLRKLEFIEAAVAINAHTSRIITKHLLPNALSPVIVSFTMGIGRTIMGAAQLSYIGLGVQPPTPEWGAMLAAARDYIRYYPHMIFFPGIAIALIVLSLNLFGDGLRDAMDPKLKS